MLTLGCHLSTKGGFLHMGEEALSLGANTFQYFTRNPRGGSKREVDVQDIASFNDFAKEHGIHSLCAYAPYDIEPASNIEERRDFTMMVMTEDLEALDSIPGQFYLIRPGSVAGISLEEGIGNLVDVFNKVLPKNANSTLLIENMPGEGNQICYTFEQIKQVLDGVESTSQVGVLLDASALWAAGYDIKDDLDGVLDEFDKVIGLDKLKAMHLNDPKEDLGSKAVRHARIGEGKVGLAALKAVVNSPRLDGVAFYIEEPKATLDIYKKDIANLTS